MPIGQLAATALVWANAFLEEPEVVQKRNFHDLETKYVSPNCQNISIRIFLKRIGKASSVCCLGKVNPEETD